MITRFVTFGALALSLAAFAPEAIADSAKTTKADNKIPRIAAVVTVYRKNSHAEMIAGRLLEGYRLNGAGDSPKLKLVSLYVDQTPESDMSRAMAEKHGFRLSKDVADALTLGTGKLAVDGVLLVAEHGTYGRSKTGQTLYPKRRLFTEIAKVFRDSGKAVPVFSDKHLANNWTDAKWLYDTAKKLKAPLMAGSSLPTAWRYPQIDLKPGSRLKEVVAVSYGGLESYGFHALEMVQTIVERRQGGETGIKSVRCLVGDAVWEAGKNNVYSRELLQQALSRLKKPRIKPGKRVEDVVRKPALFIVDYQDGLRCNILTLNGAVEEFALAWKGQTAEESGSTLVWLQDERPYMHFTYLLKGIEQMMHSGKPAWPAERTLLTSGIVHAAHVSKLQEGKLIETPYLKIKYATPEWQWKQPAVP